MRMTFIMFIIGSVILLVGTAVSSFSVSDIRSVHLYYLP